MGESKRADWTELIALAAAPPRVELDEAGRVARELYGLTGTLGPLAGERDRNFHLVDPAGRGFVLKFIDNGLPESIVAGQSAMLEHLAAHAPGLPLPSLVRTRSGAELARPTTASGAQRVRLLTYLSGTPARHATLRPALLREIGHTLGRLDHSLQGFFHPALGQPLAWDPRRAPQLLPILEHIPSVEVRAVLRASIGPLAAQGALLESLRSQALHGDAHADNLLIDAAGERCSGIIDFGDSIHGPLVLEPAVAMADFLADGVIDLAGAAELLSGYVEEQPLAAADIGGLYGLVAARIALKVLIVFWQSRSRAGHEPAHLAQPLDEKALEALEQLLSRGRDVLTAEWHEVAGTTGQRVISPGAAPVNAPAEVTAPAHRPRPLESSASPEARTALLERRHRALGAFAELSYEQPLHLVRGAGVWVYTSSGAALLDVYNNVPHVGHAHPAVAQAVFEQTRRIASNTRYLDEHIIRYAERLTATLPAGLEGCLFVNSGSEANDIAWRMAKLHTGRRGALVMTHAYHGITAAVTDLSPAIPREAPPHVETLALPGNGDGAAIVTRAIERLHSRGFAPAALIIDSGLTSSGIYDIPPHHMGPLIEAARAAGALIIGDEVQYGLGRSGSHFWGFARRGYVPDIVTLGKPVANGYPMGVVVSQRTRLEAFQKRTGFFSTFGGNPVAAAAGLAVLQALERERLMENASATGAYFRAGLCRLAESSQLIAEVRGAGLLLGVEIAEGSAGTAPRITRQLVNALRERSVLIGSEGPGANVLKLRPPMPFQPQHADMVLAALRAALTELACS